MSRRPTARIRVVKPGWFTTIQDLGRYGAQQFGVSVSGAMDRLACAIANRLVGNADHTAVVECTLKGPELLFEQATTIAITGADLTPSLDGRALPLWTVVRVAAGSRLAFGPRRAGARSYLAVAGGFEVPMELGSRATHVASRIGGLAGRALAAGDLLVGGPASSGHPAERARALPDRVRPRYSRAPLLRVVPGPQEASFAASALRALTSGAYTLSSRSNRMGYRLEGPRLAHKDSSRLLTCGTVPGALQVPPDEQPILLMADCHTTGGYPILAVVASADLHLAGQLAPGDAVAFRAISLAEAQAALTVRWSALDQVLPPQR